MRTGTSGRRLYGCCGDETGYRAINLSRFEAKAESRASSARVARLLSESRARRCSTLPRWSALTWPYLGRTRRGRLSADAAPWPVDAADVRSSLLPWSGVAICSQSSDGPAHCQCDIATLWHTNSSERNDCAIAACVICIVPCRIIGLCYGPGLRPCTAAAVRC